MLKDYPLRELNTWGVGGTCSFYNTPATEREAASSIERQSKEGFPFYILGGGSNVLVSDGQIRALVIQTGMLDSIRIKGDVGKNSVEVEAGAGVPVKKLLSLSIEAGLGGVEFLAGIPGSVGGAVWGNAGAAGIGFKDILSEVFAIDRNGHPLHLGEESLVWEYRKCPMDPSLAALVTSCVFTLKREDRGVIFEKIKKFAFLKKGQPLGKKTAGCVFKNPPGNSAGLLLDMSGCKGMRKGGAVVSASHANFIENDRNASSRDIFELSELCREMVLRDHGVKLEYEIKFLGSFEKV